MLCQGDLLNDVGSGVGQWVQQQAEELSKLQQGAAEVLGGVVHKAEESIKAGRLVSGRDTFPGRVDHLAAGLQVERRAQHAYCHVTTTTTVQHSKLHI